MWRCTKARQIIGWAVIRNPANQPIKNCVGEIALEAYCVKCKTKREIVNPQANFNAAGTPVTKGTCGVCGTRLFHKGRTETHAGMKAPEKAQRNHRSGKLVIVESPAKARTVGRFLGKGYTVRASVGHIRDLLKSELSVDVEHDFTPKYRVPNEKRPVVKELKELVKHAEEIFLATDPDREGEAIAWHLMEATEIEPKLSKRVVFMKLQNQPLPRLLHIRVTSTWTW